jgi:7-carboxy-7-deazaguanine synthase
MSDADFNQKMPSLSLRITEIFRSLQGESSYVGLPSTFIRLTGCPLRCVYCDTAYAFNGGQRQSIEAILTKVRQLAAPYVCVTGGEPLVQPGVHVLLQLLADEGYSVSLETSGAYSIEAVDNRVKCVMDLKTPGSQEQHRNLMSNIQKLKFNDEVKFVIMNREDYDWAKEIRMNELAHLRPDQILFSPSYHELSSGQLADWIVEDQLLVRMQIQLHKNLWGERQGV